MIAAVLLAACLTPPLFDASGPACTPARSLVECGCSECFTWDAMVSPTLGPPVRYDILRRNQDGTSGWIGTTRIDGGYLDDDGNPVPIDPVELWCVAKDLRMPIEGRTYRYEVAPCFANGSCLSWSGTYGQQITYVAAPYWCYSNGVKVPCP